MTGDVRKDFHDDTLLVVGSCIAGRSWRAYPDGTLTGVTYGQTWKTTGNEAYCPYVGLEKGSSAAIPGGWRHGGMFYPHGRTNPRKHRPGGIGCSCGYWCYHDLAASASWKPAGLLLGVVGVVHAYGLMTRGSKGYRAQFADIAALVRPDWADRREMPEAVVAAVIASWSSVWSWSEEPPAPETTLADVWALVTDRYPVPVYESIESAMAGIHGKATP